ncbi:D-2-hydroxyacid dehydrogenase [Rariglobus hedericola]|uniref:D-2-hydroxyacid dehydrogenase n=1 Tax=Rariglobus hedericola TaxID=2597822 RepID=A0A556QJ84_9BACT|nr:D-2-hydroxyacid dehydrogenase [Rariglobus hedericola]TSJ76689.1 D-2-hydroxyacid dehydrogenase [Rariglobus hedericola]
MNSTTIFTAPKLVVLDGHATNPGDLSWDAFHALANCRIHERTTTSEIIARAHDAEFILTNKAPLTADTLARLPKLRYIGVLATGTNVVDVPAARARGICVTNIPGYGTRSVAQHTLALILEATNHVGLHAAGVREGAWSRSSDWCYWQKPLVELDGLTLGIVGYGSIGRQVAALARAFGMKIVATSRSASTRVSDGVTFLSLERLLADSDIVSLHCPLTDDTRHLINSASLARMKPTALLINTSRGPLISEADLVEALHHHRIAGAALDVLSAEPPPPANPLLAAPNCLVTPHQAWATRAARQRLLDIAAANVRAFLSGHPQNTVGG